MISDPRKIYPRTGDTQIVYLKNVVQNPNIEVGEFTQGCRPAEAWDNRGDIVVGNDVWIGFEAVILAGVTIGDGAVIGARAVVTKDVAPYTIVGGVPAKSIRRRFPEEQTEVLLQTKWWDWPPERIAMHLADIQEGNLSGLIGEAADAGPTGEIVEKR